MRTRTICLALAIVLVCPFASAQGVQTKGFDDRQVPNHPLMGTNIFQRTPRELLRPATQHRMQAAFISRLDSLRASRMQLPFSDERFNPKGIQSGVRSLRRMSSPQSQIYVIDTAVVLRLGNSYDPGDTRRHLYTFNTSGKRTSDLTQQQISGLWVDTARRTDNYDASNNNLLDLYEQWSNG